jgi:hypothetical protein
VGVSITGILVLIGLIFFLLRRHRRQTGNLLPGGEPLCQNPGSYSPTELVDAQKLPDYLPSHVFLTSEPVEIGPGVPILAEMGTGKE